MRSFYISGSSVQYIAAHLREDFLPYMKSLRGTTAGLDKCHETRRRRLQRGSNRTLDPSLDEIVIGIYTRLLFPFTDVFCFFSADLGGLG